MKDSNVEKENSQISQSKQFSPKNTKNENEKKSENNLKDSEEENLNMEDTNVEASEIVIENQPHQTN